MLFCAFLSGAIWTLILGQDTGPEIPGSNCHSRLGVSQPGVGAPVYWLYASDGWASRARLDNNKAWVSDLPIYTDDHQPYYAWIQVSNFMTAGLSLVGAPT